MLASDLSSKCAGPTALLALAATARKKSMRSRRGPSIGSVAQEFEDCGKASMGFRFSVISGYDLREYKEAARPLVQSRLSDADLKERHVSALQIHRVMFGENSTHDYHTCWYHVHALARRDGWRHVQPLSGEIEVDETYIGGKTGIATSPIKAPWYARPRAATARRGCWIRQGRRDRSYRA